MTCMPLTLMSEILAWELGMQPEDIIGFTATRYSIDINDASDVEVEAVRIDLDSWECIRSVPELYYPGSDPDAGKDATKMR